MFRKFSLALSAFVLSMVLAGPASAAIGWVEVSLVAVGYYDTFPYIVATASSGQTATFTNTYFQLNNSAANSLLATALTASSSGKNFAIYIPGDSVYNFSVVSAACVK